MQTTTRNLPGTPRGKQPRKLDNPGRDGGNAGAGPSKDGTPQGVPRLDDFLRGRLTLKLPLDSHGFPLYVSKRNYREIFGSVRAYAKTAGKEIPFELNAGDPGVLGNILNFLRESTDNHVFFLTEENGNSAFWLAVPLISCEITAVPIESTYEKMSRSFGRLVRRFITTVFMNAGLDPSGAAISYYEEWMLDEAQNAADEKREAGEELSPDEKAFYEYVKDYFSKKPGSVGARLAKMRNYEPLSVGELRRARPRTEYEKGIHSLLLEGEKYLEGSYDLLSSAFFAFIEPDDSTCYFPEDIYFSVVWSNSGDEILERCIEMINDEAGSGCEDNGIYHWRKVGRQGPIDRDSLEDYELVRYLEKLSIEL